VCVYLIGSAREENERIHDRIIEIEIEEDLESQRRSDL